MNKTFNRNDPDVIAVDRKIVCHIILRMCNCSKDRGAGGSKDFHRSASSILS